MKQDARHQIVNLPGALRVMLEKGRPEWEKLVRQVRWGEVPVYVVGSGPSYPVGLSAAYALESLLGWPVVVRTPEEFRAYSLSTLRRRSILIVISGGGEGESAELARAAKAQGATVLALVHDSESHLAKAADGVFLLRSGEERQGGLAAQVGLLAALHCITLIAARILRRPSPQVESMEAELGSLPGQIEWVLTQLPDAVRSLAGELAGGRGVKIVAGGCYYPAALLAAHALRLTGRLCVQALRCDDLEGRLGEGLDAGEAVLVLSGSRGRVKRPLHALVERLCREGFKVLALTDRNEPEIARRAALSVLLPEVNEPLGAIIALAFLDWTALHLVPPQARPTPPPRKG